MLALNAVLRGPYIANTIVGIYSIIVAAMIGQSYMATQCGKIPTTYYNSPHLRLISPATFYYCVDMYRNIYVHRYFRFMYYQIADSVWIVVHRGLGSSDELFTNIPFFNRLHSTRTYTDTSHLPAVYYQLVCESHFREAVEWAVLVWDTQHDNK